MGNERVYLLDEWWYQVECGLFGPESQDSPQLDICDGKLVPHGAISQPWYPAYQRPHLSAIPIVDLAPLFGAVGLVSGGSVFLLLASLRVVSDPVIRSHEPVLVGVALVLAVVGASVVTAQWCEEASAG